MAGNGAQGVEGTEQKVENAPPPTEGKGAVVGRRAAVEPPAPSGEERAAEASAPTGDQDTIRSVFVARTAASAASVGGFAQMETTDDRHVVRGAYCARLAVVVAEAVAGAPAVESDVLRKAYLARAVAEMAAQPRPAKQSAAGKQKKAPAVKAKQRAARASSAKPKKLGGAGVKAKPRAVSPRAAAARRGKRRGR
jgi:hypothetical protein